jgi:hypothetical protein
MRVPRSAHARAGHHREVSPRVVRSPDFRVILLRALPRFVRLLLATAFTQWFCSNSSPVTVAGAVPVLNRLPV